MYEVHIYKFFTDEFLGEAAARGFERGGIRMRTRQEAPCFVEAFRGNDTQIPEKS